MSVENEIVLSIMAYKLASLGVGLMSLYMGYRLFISGVWGKAGDINVRFDNNILLVKQAAPGTFFALFGTIIVCFTLFKGVGFKVKTAPQGSAQHQTSEVKELPEIPPIPGDVK